MQTSAKALIIPIIHDHTALSPALSLRGLITFLDDLVHSEPAALAGIMAYRIAVGPREGFTVLPNPGSTVDEIVRYILTECGARDVSLAEG
jgi:hypothetical protein